MKLYKYITYIVLFLLTSPIMLAQTYAIGNSTATSGTFQSRAAQLSILASQRTSPSNAQMVTTNAVYIQQVGNNNNVVSNTSSSRSNINLFQRGNNNEVGIDVTAGIIDENVIQNGNNNSFFDFSPNTTMFHRAAVYQSGTNQNLLWYGNNSISEKLMVRMKGKNQTVIIRNIKR
jgi:hypothetical protein